MDPLVFENISCRKWQIATSVLILHFINLMHPMKIQSCHIRSGDAPPPGRLSRDCSEAICYRKLKFGMAESHPGRTL